MREEEIVWPKCYNIKQLTSDTMNIKWYCNQTINHVQQYSRNLEEQYRLRIKYSKGSQRQWLIHGKKLVTVIIYGLKQKARQNYSENTRHQQTERINKEPNGEIIEGLSHKTPQERVE